MTVERIPAGDRAAWLALRKRDVTASEIAALFDAHPYKTRFGLYADKTGAGVDAGDNPAMRRGRILEPAVAEAWFEERRERLVKCDEYLRCSVRRIGATPDYTRPNGEPVELKTVAPERWEEWGNTPPLAYQLQALVQAMLMDAPRAWLAVMVDNRAKDLLGRTATTAEQRLQGTIEDSHPTPRYDWPAGCGRLTADSVAQRH